MAAGGGRRPRGLAECPFHSALVEYAGGAAGCMAMMAKRVAIAVGSMALLLLVASVALAVAVLRGGAEPAPGAFTPLSLGGPSGEALAVGSPAPEVALLDLEGRPMRLSEYRG